MTEFTGAADGAAAAAAAAFPVVFFDGEREIDIGTVAVHASLGFKKFQAVISQKIGIGPHQISTSLVRRKKARLSPEVRRKVPIDESSDFAAIARERDCFVLAVLRRSRRERRGRSRRGGGHRHGGDGDQEIVEQKKASSMAPEKTILRRNPSGFGFDPSLSRLMPEASVGLGFWDYESQLRNLQRQRERYLMSTASYDPYSRPLPPATTEERYLWMAGLGGPRSPPAMAAAGPGAVAAAAPCEECEGAKVAGRPPVFHWCVHDAVTVGFRSPVGPIQRPPKEHVKSSA